MENVVTAYALNMAPEQAIAPRQMFSWMLRKIGVGSLPSHILAYTKVDLADAG
jgi:hypothetical protein